MNRRIAAFTLTAAVLFLGVGGGWLAVRSRAARAELDDVRSLLPYRSLDWGRSHLAVLAAGWGSRAEARAGLALLDTLAGAEVTPAPATFEHIGSFPVAALLERSLAQEEYEACLRATDALARAKQPDFPSYRAAALVELGRFAEARSITLAANPTTRLRRRLAEVLETDLGTVFVRDRSGVLLGRVRADEPATFVPEKDVRAGLVAPAALAGLAEVIPARSVRLTLDLELSRIAQRALGSYRGSIVVLDPWDGSVLAAVSDRRTASREESPAFEQLREPASIAKLITVSAALRAGVDVDHELADMTCRGSLAFPEGRLYCSAVNGRLRGLDRAMAVSCNVAFAYLGTKVGNRGLVDEYRRFGFDHEARAPYFGHVLRPDAVSRDLGELSIGLEASAITPVHAALEAATIANGGRMHEPRVLRATDSFLGFSERRLAADPGWQVLESGWPALLTEAMEAVVAPGGTAARVAPSDFPIALKTGTASEPRSGFHVNYIGFGPVREPRFAFAIRLTHQRSSRRVRNAAYAVTRRFLRELRTWARLHPGVGVAPAPAAVSTAS